MSDDARLRDRITHDRLLLAAVLLVGIAGTGIVRRQLGLLGYNAVGRVVYVLGYGGTVFAVWYGWIRPLDITGPDESRELTRPRDESAESDDAARPSDPSADSNDGGTDDAPR